MVSIYLQHLNKKRFRALLRITSHLERLKAGDSTSLKVSVQFARQVSQSSLHASPSNPKLPHKESQRGKPTSLEKMMDEAEEKKKVQLKPALGFPSWFDPSFAQAAAAKTNERKSEASHY